MSQEHHVCEQCSRFLEISHLLRWVLSFDFSSKHVQYMLICTSTKVNNILLIEIYHQSIEERGKGFLNFKKKV